MKLEIDIKDCSECPFVSENKEYTFNSYRCKHPVYEKFSVHIGNKPIIQDWCPLRGEKKGKL